MYSTMKASARAVCCSQALLNIISNPVNSTVPIAAEVLKQKGTYDPKRLFGVTTLDVVSPHIQPAPFLGLGIEELQSCAGDFTDEASISRVKFSGQGVM